MMKLRTERKHDARLDGGFRYCGVAAAVIGGSLIAGGASIYSSSKASSAQQSAAQSAQDTQLQMYNQTRDDQAPYRQAGTNALSKLSAGTAPGGQFTHTFDANDLKTSLAPNYDFQLQQGMGALNNQASVAGGMVGGNALKGISDYAQGSAASAYQQAFNNYNTNQTNIYNRLSSIAGLGQTSNGQTAQVGMNAAGNIGSAQLASGAAQAAGYTGIGNAVSGAGNSISSMYALNGMSGGSLFGNSAPVGTSASYAANNLLTS